MPKILTGWASRFGRCCYQAITISIGHSYELRRSQICEVYRPGRSERAVDKVWRRPILAKSAQCDVILAMLVSALLSVASTRMRPRALFDFSGSLLGWRGAIAVSVCVAAVGMVSLSNSGTADERRADQWINQIFHNMALRPPRPVPAGGTASKVVRETVARRQSPVDHGQTQTAVTPATQAHADSRVATPSGTMRFPPVAPLE
jgi:hypothetical protein